MRDIRHGEHLWQSWEGEGYFSDTHAELIYFTVGDVDINNEIVRRALASTLQRDGIADSLSDGFKLLETSYTQGGFAGFLPDETEYTVCDEDGETEYGDTVQEVLDITWVEFRHSDLT
jgi:hypothetical protein